MKHDGSTGKDHRASRSRLVAWHAGASWLAFGLLLGFWSSSAGAEWVGDHATILRVKTAILATIPGLVGALVTAGATGARLAGNGPPSRTLVIKQVRMKVMAANGAGILVPSAVVLWWLASQPILTTAFYWLQAVELTAGAVNLTLLALNLRDGRRLRRRRTADGAAGAAGPSKGRHAHRGAPAAERQKA
jgi:hypothetical protein